MRKHNENNERIKRRYFSYLKEAQRYSEQTVDAVSKSISRFETYNNWRDFKTFRSEQAVAFKRHLAEQRNIQTGQKLSKATANSTLANLKRFIHWLAGQPGYRSRLNYSDADYFNLSAKDVRIASAIREQLAPTLVQIKHVIETMPSGTDVQERDRALMAFTLLTGARDSATASLKLKHVDIESGLVRQDARDVRTKFSKTFNTYFLPIDLEARAIVDRWVIKLRNELHWGEDDPLFPATHVKPGANRRFEVVGLKRSHWSSASPIRAIFKRAFVGAGLPYFFPHSFRHTLTLIGQKVCKTPEQFKAWSQNFGHDGVRVTFESYGTISCQRQGEIMRELAEPQEPKITDVQALAKALALEMKSPGSGVDRGIEK